MAESRRELFTKQFHVFSGSKVTTGVSSIDKAYDELLKKLTDDWTKDPPRVVAISGLVGQAPGDPKRARVYLTKSLDDFVEFDVADAVAYAQRPDGWGAILWVKKEASLLHVWSGVRSAQEIFLGGNITEAYLPQADQSLGGAWAGLPIGRSPSGGPCTSP